MKIPKPNIIDIVLFVVWTILTTVAIHFDWPIWWTIGFAFAAGERWNHAWTTAT